MITGHREIFITEAGGPLDCLDCPSIELDVLRPPHCHVGGWPHDQPPWLLSRWVRHIFNDLSWQSPGIRTDVVIWGNFNVFPHHLCITCTSQLPPVLLCLSPHHEEAGGVAGGVATFTAALQQRCPTPGLVLLPGDIGVSGTEQESISAVISHHWEYPAWRGGYWSQLFTVLRLTKQINTKGEVMVVTQHKTVYTVHCVTCVTTLTVPYRMSWEDWGSPGLQVWCTKWQSRDFRLHFVPQLYTG